MKQHVFVKSGMLLGLAVVLALSGRSFISPAQAQSGGSTSADLVIGPFNWARAAGGRVNHDMYIPIKRNATPVIVTPTYEVFSVSKIGGPRGHRTLGGYNLAMNSGDLVTVELIQTDKTLDLRVNGETKESVEVGQDVGSFIVHATTTCSGIAAGQALPNVSMQEMTPAGVWKEFRPAEEQLKANPRH